MLVVRSTKAAASFRLRSISKDAQNSRASWHVEFDEADIRVADLEFLKISCGSRMELAFPCTLG